ncbi:MAG: hypothetical protein NTY15_14455 [Planctomycetota bacterium]|jgi:hypothetical protein|nr:hypothetical protein [Planctomycetota bacterium]
MAKFYVQSGTLRAIIDSEDAERAALWAVHMAMQQVMPIENEQETIDMMSDGPSNMVALAETIELSEVGFDRDDSLRVDTFEAFQHWNLLFKAVEKLNSLLDG